MTNEQVKAVLERVRAWPRERQEELAAIALEIEAEFGQRIYRATPEELETLDESEKSGLASQEDIETAYNAFRR